MMEPLKSLVEGAQQGDFDAFNQIVRRFQGMAYATAYAMLGQSQAAEDAAQEAFIEAYLSLPNMRDPAAFPGWFRRIVIKQGDRQLRARHHLALALDETADLAAAEPGPEQAAEQSELRAALVAALFHLPPHQRIVVALYYLDSYTQPEIAAYLELPVSTVKKRLFDARHKLREEHAMLKHHLPGAPEDDALAGRVRFFVALRQRRLDTLERLIQADPALLTARTQFGVAAEGVYWPLGITALHWAAAIDDLDMLQRLLALGADVEVRGRGEATPLHVAVQMDHPAAVRALIAAGADLDARTTNGFTPLHLAVMHGRARLAALLIEAGGQRDPLDSRGRTPLDWARLKDDDALIALLTTEEEDPMPTPPVTPPETFGAALAGQTFNAAGDSLDGAPRPAAMPDLPAEADESAADTLLPTGIKIIDLLAPLKRGGEHGLFAPVPGLGKLVVLGEIVHNLAVYRHGFTVVMALQTTAQAANELMLAWRELRAHEYVTQVFGPLESDTAQRREIVRRGLALADALRAEGHTVLLLVDEVLGLTDGLPALLHQYVTRSGATLLYFGDADVGALPEPFQALDAVLTFSQARAEQGLYPAIDPQRSTSRLLAEGGVLPEHARIARQVRQILAQYSKLGLHELADAPQDDPAMRQTAIRGWHLDRLFTQPFFAAEVFTGNAGEYHDLAPLLETCQRILDGEYDTADPLTFDAFRANRN